MHKKAVKKATKKLSGAKTEHASIDYGADNIELFSLIKEGLPYESVEDLLKQGVLSANEITYFIPVRTLARRKQSKKLSQEESDTVARLAQVFNFATNIFGSKEKAKTWLHTPNRALKGEIPFHFLSTSYGSRIVETILGRIAHGIPS